MFGMRVRTAGVDPLASVPWPVPGPRTYTCPHGGGGGTGYISSIIYIHIYDNVIWFML